MAGTLSIHSIITPSGIPGFSTSTFEPIRSLSTSGPILATSPDNIILTTTDSDTETPTPTLTTVLGTTSEVAEVSRTFALSVTAEIPSTSRISVSEVLTANTQQASTTSPLASTNIIATFPVPVTATIQPRPARSPPKAGPNSVQAIPSLPIPTNIQLASSSNKSSPADITGAVVGGVLLAALSASLIGVSMRRRRKRYTVSPFVDPPMRRRTRGLLIVSRPSSISVQRNSSPPAHPDVEETPNDRVQNSSEIRVVLTEEDSRNSPGSVSEVVEVHSDASGTLRLEFQEDRGTVITQVIDLPPLYTVQ